MDLDFNSIDELTQQFTDFNIVWSKLVELNDFNPIIFQKSNYVTTSNLSYDDIINYKIGEKNYLYYKDKKKSRR